MESSGGKRRAVSRAWRRDDWTLCVFMVIIPIRPPTIHIAVHQDLKHLKHRRFWIKIFEDIAGSADLLDCTPTSHEISKHHIFRHLHNNRHPNTAIAKNHKSITKQPKQSERCMVISDWNFRTGEKKRFSSKLTGLILSESLSESLSERVS